MPTNISKNTLRAGWLALALVAHNAAWAEPPSESLEARRLSIIKGTSKGVVLFDFPAAARPAAAASATTTSTANTDATATAPTNATAPTSATALTNAPAAANATVRVPPAVSALAATPAPTKQAATATAALPAPAPQAEASSSLGSRFFSLLPPPSGRSIQSAKRLNAPDQGIAIPTAQSVSEPAAAEAGAAPRDAAGK